MSEDAFAMFFWVVMLVWAVFSFRVPPRVPLWAAYALVALAYFLVLVRS